jgi:hypothetical protein
MKIYVNNLLVQFDTSATSSYTLAYTTIAIYFISTAYMTTSMHTHTSFWIHFVWSTVLHSIPQHSHIRNNLNSCRRWRNYIINRWHLLHHVLPLEELATSGLKQKIDYTQSRTQPQSKLKHACISMDAYQKVGSHVEHAVKVILCDCSVTVGEDMTIRAIQPPGVWDGHCSLVWDLRHDCCLRGDREGEGDRMDDYFCMAPISKVWWQIMAPK